MIFDPSRKAEFKEDLLLWVKGEGLPFDEILAKYRISAVKSAVGGDTRELVGLYEGELALNDAEQAMISDILKGQVKVRKDQTKLEEMSSLALSEFFYTNVVGWGKEATVAELREVYGQGRSTIFDKLRKSHKIGFIQTELWYLRFLLAMSDEKNKDKTNG
ncbi:hypothetical protein [Planktotalea arctica]|uniref:hypothetical protein n=1 Tax=Planktotalea arctica TaxID=1481893 RepID=UPI000A1741AA|nr:hypothetical protein [Planktotalea arctica]